MKLPKLLFGLSLACLLAEPARPGPIVSVPPWQRWAENPIGLRLLITGNFKGASNSPMVINIGNAWQTNGALDCSVSTNFTTVVAYLKPLQPSRLTITGTSVYSTHLEFAVPPGLDLSVARSVRGIPNAPKEYKVFIDGVEKYSIDDSNPGGCTTYSKTWFVEIRRDNDVQRRNSAGRDDDYEVPEGVAPGDADWPEIGPGKSSLPEVAGIRWSVGLGRLLGGKSAGRLHFLESGLSSNSFMPPSLILFQPFTNHTEVTVITNQDTNAYVLRQIKAPQTFVDIISNQYQMDLRFYWPESVSQNTNAAGVYTLLTNNPFVMWKISNPDQSYTATKRILFEENRNGFTVTNEIAYDSTNKAWTLQKGAGTDRVTEMRCIYVDGNGERWETNTIQDASSVAYKAIEQYHPFDWGWELVSVVTDPEGPVLNQTFSYYTNAADGAAYEKLKAIVYPDGFWEKRLYHQATEPRDPWITIYARPWKDKLAHILRPLKDVPSSPDEADTSNCFDTEYLYMEIGVIDTGQSFGVALGKINQRYAGNRNSVQEYETRYEPTLHLERQLLMLGDTYENWPTVSGSERHSATESGPDTCGQLYSTFEQHVLQTSYYYDWGSYQEATFVVTNGSDWRQVAVHGRTRGFPSRYGGNWSWDNTGSRIIGSSTAYVYSLEGHDIRGMHLLPGQSTKDIDIRHRGSVVQREHYVYSGTNYNSTIFELLYKEVIEVDSLGHLTRISRVDGVSGASRVVYEADWTGTNTFPGPIKLKEIDEDGIELVYTYDGMRRLKTVTRNGCPAGDGYPAQADLVTTYSYDAAGRVTARIESGGSLSATNLTLYDRAGRVISEKNPNGIVATNQYANGGRSITTTYSGGGTKVVSRFLSRNIKSITGSTVVGEYYDYGRTSNQVPDQWADYPDWFDEAAFRSRTLGSESGPRTVRSVFGLVGFRLYDAVPGNGSSLTNWINYDGLDRVHSKSSPDCSIVSNRMMYLDFDLMQLTNATWLYVDGDDWVPKSDSRDRLTTVDVAYGKIGSDWFRSTTGKTFLMDSNATPTTSVTRERLTSLDGDTKAEITSVDVHSNTTVQTVYVNRTAKRVTTVQTTDASTLAATNVSVNGLLQSESTFSVATPSRFEYDGLRRRTGAVTPRGVRTTTSYDPATGQMTVTTDFAGNATQYQYYGLAEANAGMLKRVTRPNGKCTYYGYNGRGQQTRAWGDVPLPEERIYNDYGELVELHTYRGGTGWNSSSWPANPGTADVTTWNYQATTGLISNKTDAAGRTVNYSYYTNNELRVRSWARSVRATNIYSLYGDLIRIDYSDGTSNVVFEAIDRAGQPRVVRDASGDHVLRYDYAHRLISDSCTNGLLAGVVVSNHFQSLYGRDYLEVQGVSPALHQGYAYEGYGRLSSVSAENDSAIYSYLPNSDRLQSTVFQHGQDPVLTTTRTWEYEERLQSIGNSVNGATVSAHQYLYDAVQRRTQATLADGSRWQYAYNDRDEVVSGKRFWEDWVPVAGQQFEYAYDNIGNRTASKAGGDANGNGLRSAGYTANSLNQYTTVTNAALTEVVGAGVATNAVEVNGGTNEVYRRGEYYRREWTVPNTGSPVWQSVSVNCGSSNVSGGVIAPRAQQTLTYDYDGNLTFDGIWAYRWDSENRLVEMSMTNVLGVPATARKRLAFDYDFQGRRVQKTVSAWNGSTFTNAGTTRFVYDGWNVVAILDSQSSVLRSFLWGQDLSGTMDKAGGIGGLLAIGDHESGNCHFVAYDGNGNVTALVDRSTNVTAHYEYGPFGESIRATGAAASANPFRWSTKFTDEDTDLVYYGLRLYSSTAGRWINRDPAEEKGGNNLYAFAFNSPTTGFDTLGDVWVTDTLRIDADYERGAHVHDLGENVSYGFGTDPEGGLEVRPLVGHEAEFDLTRATRSLQGIFQNREAYQALKTANASAWRRIGQTVGRLTRSSVRAVGKAIKAAGRAAGVAGAVFAIAAAVEGSTELANAMDDYQAHAARGENAMMDLDAIDVAIGVQTMTENYFVTMDVLGILLQ